MVHCTNHSWNVSNLQCNFIYDVIVHCTNHIWRLDVYFCVFYMVHATKQLTSVGLTQAFPNNIVTTSVLYNSKVSWQNIFFHAHSCGFSAEKLAKFCLYHSLNYSIFSVSIMITVCSNFEGSSYMYVVAKFLSVDVSRSKLVRPIFDIHLLCWCLFQFSLERCLYKTEKFHCYAISFYWWQDIHPSP